jgi:glucose-6-phosphate dehydrogenase assembly protein OpcA
MEDYLVTAPAADIQIPDIDKELKRLWKASQQIKQIRACLFTLVIYAPTSHRAHYMQELVEMILEKFPCRIIFIRTDLDPDKDHLRVEVSHAISGKLDNTGGTTIACDRIDIDASESQMKRIPFLITPHLVPDLPVYLLWGQIPYQDKVLYPSLEKFASRVIFDSECVTDINVFCQNMLKHLETSPIEIMDINWALLSQWRDLLGQLFGTEEKLSMLTRSKSMIITYNTTQKYTMSHPEIRALYMQAWLASRMNWKFFNVETFQGNLVISYISENNPVIVALAPFNDETAPPGAILNIELRTIDDNILSIIRKSNLPQVLVHVSTKETCELPIVLPLPNVYRGLNFLREIFFSVMGEHYRDMLAIISEMQPKKESDD